MKNLTNNFFTFILLSLFTLTGVANAQTVDCKTDDFTGNTHCQSNYIDLPTDETDFNRFMASVGYFDQKDSYFILIGGSSDEWQWLREDTIYFLIDGERVKKKLHDQESDVDGGTIYETKFTVVSKSFLERILSAEQTRFKISDDVSEFNTDVKNAIRNTLQKAEQYSK